MEGPDPFNTDDPENVESMKFFAVYVIIAFLIFGWTYNHNADCLEIPAEHKASIDFCKSQIGLSSAFKGVIWPVYLLGKFAIAITRWP